MRLRICRQPTGSIDGVSLKHFCPGAVYDVGTQLASVLLAEGWAEPVEEADGANGRRVRDRIVTPMVVRDDGTA